MSTTAAAHPPAAGLASATAPAMAADEAPAGAVHKAAIPLLGLIAGLQMIDPAVANVAIVDAGRTLEFSTTERALGASISTLALAATVLASGLAADRLGRRPVLVAALLLTLIGDVLVAIAPWSLLYLSGRALAGVGLGAAFAATFAYVRFVSRQSRLGASLGLWNSVGISSLIVGSVLGGLLAVLSWRVAMLLVPALVLLYLPFISKMLPPMPRTGGGRVDVAGLAVIGVAMVLLLFGISETSTSLSSPLFYGPVLAGLAGFGLFAVMEARSKHPAFPIRLFLRNVFLSAVLIGITWNFGQAIAQLSATNYWQYVKRLDTLATAGLQLPFLVSVAVCSILVGRRLSSHPEKLRRLLVSGFIALVAGFLALSIVGISSPAWILVPGMVVVGAGLALTSVPQAQLFVSEAPPDAYGAVTSFRTTVGQLGYALGLAGGVVIVQLVSKVRFVGQLGAEGIPPSRVAKAIAEVHLYLHSSGAPQTEEARRAIDAATRAYNQGFDLLMLITAGIVAIMAVVSLLLLRQKKQAAEKPVRRGAKGGVGGTAGTASGSVD